MICLSRLDNIALIDVSNCWSKRENISIGRENREIPYYPIYLPSQDVVYVNPTMHLVCFGPLRITVNILYRLYQLKLLAPLEINVLTGTPRRPMVGSDTICNISQSTPLEMKVFTSTPHRLVFDSDTICNNISQSTPLEDQSPRWHTTLSDVCLTLISFVSCLALIPFVSHLPWKSMSLLAQSPVSVFDIICNCTTFTCYISPSVSRS